jgi:hypothetical protein
VTYCCWRALILCAPPVGSGVLLNQKRISTVNAGDIYKLSGLLREERELRILPGQVVLRTCSEEYVLRIWDIEIFVKQVTRPENSPKKGLGNQNSI